VLTAPGAISQATADRAKAYWEENFTAENAGKVAVLGDGLKYEAMTMTAVDAQLIEQLRWNDATIAGAFGVPTHMINGAAAPATNNVEALNQQYYSQCLQIHVESIELLIDEGLGLDQVTGRTLGTEFDLHDLLRMDTATKVRTASEGVRGGIFKPNEARAWFDLEPVTGGHAVYLQQQNYSLEALAKRDAKEDPFSSSSPRPALPAPDEEDETEDPETLEAVNDNMAAESQRALAVFTMGLAA
jgi:phage portal protein BeeE